MTFFAILRLEGCSFLFPADPPPGSIVGPWLFALSGDSFDMTLSAGLTFTQASLFSCVSHMYSGTYTSNSSSIVFTTTVVDGIGIAPQVAAADYSLSPNGTYALARCT